ncbi:hypothetical protein [Janthinobacterium sp. RT4P48]|uniref:hypothetical protein n=1 Tax=Janthinobacterium sp. RT4P48 TaxID=3424188 RepID=UPI003F20150C
MPAGRGKRCEACYWTATFFKRLALDEAGLSTPRMVSSFRDFGNWLIVQVPAQKAAQSIHRYFPFFYEMEEQWGAIPTYENLLMHFTAEGLRRVRLPMRWLSESALVIVDADTRESASEHRRLKAIGSLLEADKDSTAIFLAYKETLFARMGTGKTTLRTVRLLLQSAAALLAQCLTDGVRIPGQPTLDRYLAKVPGQRNNISGFVSFLNSKYDLCIRVDHGSKHAAARRTKKLEIDLVALLGEDNHDAIFLRRWLSISLAYFHGLPRKAGMSLKDEQVLALVDGSFNVTVDQTQYWVPHWDAQALLP